MKTITIITPTYNRKHELESAFESLKRQTVQDFEWMIIDDGSTDNTDKLVEEMKKESKFPIYYKYQKNQGKHVALNVAFRTAKTELLMILDSDDILVEIAVEQILEVHKKYKDNEKIAGYVFQKGKINNPLEKMASEFKEEEFIDNYNSYIINKGIKGDKEEIFKTKIINKFQYPQYENETFLGEGVLWSKIGHQYDMVFCNKIIYLCEYLSQGLTKSGRKLRMKNPNGGKYHAEEYLDKHYSSKVRLKNAILYLIYSKVLNEQFKKILKQRKEKILLLIAKLPSEVLYYMWKK